MKFPDQVEEIEGIVKRLGMAGHEELADAAMINRETMRKYANGYQPMPAPLRKAIQLVEENRKLQSSPMRETNQSPGVFVSYNLMETPTLMSSLSDLASKLRKASNQDRKYVIGNLRAMLDELESRELTGALKLDESEERALGTAPAALRIVRESGPRRKAAAPSEDKHARDSGVHQGSK